MTTSRILGQSCNNSVSPKGVRGGGGGGGGGGRRAKL